MTAMMKTLGRNAAFVLGAAAGVVILGQILLLFAYITVGVRGGETFLSAFLWLQSHGAPIGLGYTAVIAWALLAAPGLLIFLRLTLRRSGWPAVTLVASSAAIFLTLAVSYRFLSLLAAIAFAVAAARRGTSHPNRALLPFLFATVVTLASSSYDVSLRIRPQGSRFAPAVSGCLTGEAGSLDDAGEIVIVGGGQYVYNEPAWVWVW